MTSMTFETHVKRPVIGLGPYGSQVLAAVMAGFRSHVILYAIALGCYAIGIIECLVLQLPVNFNLVEIVSGTTFLFLGVAIGVWLAFDLVRLWRAGYSESPTLALIHKLQTDILAPTRVANALHAFLVNGIFFVGFLAIKKAIPHVVSFSWDQPFMALDKAIHGGVLPHEWLLPLLGSPDVLFITNVLYNLWFAVLLFCFFWFGYARQDSFLRQRYLIAYLSLWFVGTCVLGTVFSSAGPCFYGYVQAGVNPYENLMESLKFANTIYPIWAVPTQEMLWQSHLAGHGDVEGVSAMPSLHVATSVLFVLQARAWGQRWFLWFSIPFAAIILVGSVMLGWHYAVDGYAGALIAVGCWWFAGKIAPRPEAQN
jgi:membrane-associated phospholipid phosphatase